MVIYLRWSDAARTAAEWEGHGRSFSIGLGGAGQEWHAGQPGRAGASTTPSICETTLYARHNESNEIPRELLPGASYETAGAQAPVFFALVRICKSGLGLDPRSAAKLPRPRQSFRSCSRPLPTSL